MRLLVVSNRLPVTIVKKDKGYSFEKSVGGLTAGLSAYLDYLHGSPPPKISAVWIGWPGVEIAAERHAEIGERLFAEANAHPVFLEEAVMDRFYNGFCNKTIWPLFHYFPSLTRFDEESWEEYKRVNAIFCDVVLKVYKPDDIVWIHDYHLMLLPQMLREKIPGVKIGFFLHIPFPSLEIFRLLPVKWRSEILTGLLGANLAGFHTHDYTQYFLRCVLRFLGLENNLGQILVGGRLVFADTFPMGIDFERYNKASLIEKVQTAVKELKKGLGRLKVVLSIDRLDYSKGILNRLLGFESFLQANPSWRGKVLLLLVLIPSRVQVEQYQQMKSSIDGLVGRINGKFGTFDWTPIIYQYRFLSFEELSALYIAGDAALITPLRDGMNLVAKEFVASKDNETGVLVLSEMAGASRELGEALIINPTTSGEIADAIKTALEMPVSEQKRRNRIMQARLKDYNIIRWAEDFTHKLSEAVEEQKKISARVLDKKSADRLVTAFREATERLVFLDYDGTLVPLAPDPGSANPPEDVLDLLKRLGNLSHTDVVLISGRDRATIEKWFGNTGISFIAEHGVWIKEARGGWESFKPLRNYWKSQIFPVLKSASDRLPGSFVEEKEYSLVWHYRRADPELASVREKELIDDLVSFTANIDVQVTQGHKIIEVRNAGISKGHSAGLILKRKTSDFVLAVGDDSTDEDLFRILPKEAFSIRVGITHSYARFNLSTYREVTGLLNDMITAVQSR